MMSVSSFANGGDEEPIISCHEVDESDYCLPDENGKVVWANNSGGLDVSLQAMLYNFGNTNFSKGFGVGIGGGLHYLADFNRNIYFERKRDIYVTGKGTFFLFPLKVEIFYQHLFDNNWFIKSGIKGHVLSLLISLKDQK